MTTFCYFDDLTTYENKSNMGKRRLLLQLACLFASAKIDFLSDRIQRRRVAFLKLTQVIYVFYNCFLIIVTTFKTVIHIFVF